MADKKYVPDYEQLPGRWYVLFYSPQGFFEPHKGLFSVTTGRTEGFATWSEAVSHAERLNTANQRRSVTTEGVRGNLRYFVINEADAKEFNMVIVEGRMLWPEEVRQMTTPGSGGSG